MKVSVDWLTDFVEIDQSPEELADMLSLIGLEALAEKERHDFSGVIIGEVKSVEKVPDSDHLTLCMVDTGVETLSIVCGAPNVRVGQRVPVAVVGAVLPGNFKIKKARIRGTVSHGMICAEDELGLSTDHAGIMVLDPDAPLGQDFKRYLSKGQVGVLDLDLTPNRGDAFSHLGVARDIAAKLNRKVTTAKITLTESGPPIDTLAQVSITSPEGAHRYAARVVLGIRIGPSPQWLADRLSAIGMRPINNVVDASNYVMMELGQPLHVFDYDRLAEHRIDVTFAKAGQKFTTLDGVEHTLGGHHLLIADGDGPVALAGIMGGENSEVTDATTNILIESAYFAPAVIRKGAKSLDLSTEASKRFERDIDIDGVIVALDRVTQLIADTAGGEIASGRIDIYPVPHEPQIIDISTRFANRLTGLELSQKEIAAALKRLSIAAEVADDDVLRCTVPLNRPELRLEVDLIEEVARMVGYETIPPVMGIDVRFDGIIADSQAYMEPLRRSLVNLGFHEHLSVTLTELSLTGLFSDAPPVTLANPLTSEMNCLRNSLLPGLLQAQSFNENRQQKGIRLFEIGAIHAADDSLYNRDREQFRLAILASEGAALPHWKPQPPADIFFLKGVVQRLLEDGGRQTVTWKAAQVQGLADAMVAERGGEVIGRLGVVSGELRQKFNLQSAAVVADIDLQALVNTASDEIEYRPVIPFPIVERDMALETPHEAQAGDLLTAIWEAGSKILRDVRLFDLYSGDQVAADRKSLAYRLYLQADDRTLTDAEVDREMEKIAAHLAQRHQTKWRRA